MAVLDCHAVAVRADAEASSDEAGTVPAAEKFLRFLFHLFFFAADKRDHVAENIKRRNSGIPRARDGLHSDDEHFFQAESLGERFQDQNQSGSGAIWIGNDESRAVAAIFLLYGNGIKMRGIHFRYQQRDVGRHAMILGIADHGIASACEVFLGRAGNGRIERGKNKIAIERGFQIFYDEIRCR